VTATDVVRSVRRARFPSGFAAVRAARAISKDTVDLKGSIDDWPDALATAAYVLPDGRWDPEVTSGPLQFVRYRQDAELHLRASSGAPVAFKDWRLQFFDQGGSLIERLSSGELDAAHLPSAVNLVDRLDRQEIAHASALGWEWIGLKTSDDAVAGALARSVRSVALQEAFIRSDGEPEEVRWPPAGESEGNEGYPGSAVGASFTVAVPTGDELLAMLQKAIQLQSEERGAVMELADAEARTFYGRWQSQAPVDALLMRSVGAPFLSLRAPEAVGPNLSLFRVKTYVAWGGSLAPLSVNPTIEGPLWDVEGWRRAVPEGE
jgi:hypothetical protein